jgi:hypothetical protein
LVVGVLGFIAGLVTPPPIYSHAACYLSRNPKALWLKDLEAVAGSKISLNNQDKVENAKSSLSAIVKKRY